MSTENTKKTVEMVDEGTSNDTELKTEQAVAENSGGYTHKFKKPVEIENKKYDRLHFDFEALTGKDMLKIEREIFDTDGITIINPDMSGDFVLRMAAKAAGIGFDVLMAMPITEVNKIRKEARNFLKQSER